MQFCLCYSRDLYNFSKQWKRYHLLKFDIAYYGSPILRQDDTNKQIR